MGLHICVCICNNPNIIMELIFSNPYSVQSPTIPAIFFTGPLCISASRSYVWGFVIVNGGGSGRSGSDGYGDFDIHCGPLSFLLEC